MPPFSLFGNTVTYPLTVLSPYIKSVTAVAEVGESEV
jgi:hypothetical protein